MAPTRPLSNARPFPSLCALVRACRACAGMRHVHVLGPANGPLDAAVLLVAEAPGRLGAARTGVPMTADVTGRRFDAFLAHARIDRARCFVTNTVLCNPVDAGGNNRRPSPREAAACSRFLRAQLDLVRAPVVVALGAVALDALRLIEPHDAVLRRDCGRALPWAGRALVPLYHPGVRSTLTRPHDQQMADWRALGALLARANAR